ncbi:leucine-rich repeat domain-containing protein [Nostoc sp. 'Lobaria pulmonaria (5183) cyanobiont']|uniref:leucine-rich repeat domain-containing protein n=1 Tax=Nostoc sp. 'Lobaria pulmonaria (5183) cyanobiont' TaxID=1618022 RepID=UPI000CF359E7|nr:leucine-rich repeat domain-containing protein [Nostoc sp. 'Lobaria pulmonaria (5183) cyanobiont']
MTNEELLQIIQKAARDKVTELDLSGKGLTTLPPEIGQLTNLRSLHLHNNQLSSLPAEIVQLTNLRSLHLFNNQLSSLPPEFGQLTNLLKDMNTLTPDIHSESDFESLLNAIAQRLDE